MNYCIIICGPTAIGKTTLAIELANYFSTEIISADSRQCYRELNIGVAKPSEEQLSSIRHHFINSHSITQPVTVADFEQDALKAVEEIFKKQSIAIMVGGTGLYIRAFTQGMDHIPPISNTLRTSLMDQYVRKGKDWLIEEIKTQDPEYFAKGEIHNPQRTLRALEVKLASGKSILTFQTGTHKNRNFNCIVIGLQIERPMLYDRINKRVEDMVQHGLEAEARSLYGFRHLNALQTVGYQEFFEYFDETINRSRAIELIKQHSRNYAKRQITWFKNEPGIQFCNPSYKELTALLHHQIKP